ncbi:MAG: redoxin domain-containing protein [Gemmatimonadetes bacterium]|nr:redoxin domain-containing protein [Gemmatimonadota bacterium]
MISTRLTAGAILAAGLALGAAPAARAQQPAPAAPAPVSMLGQVAPDFTLPSVTKEGGVRPFHLADFKGQTVVLFFFPKARTKG